VPQRETGMTSYEIMLSESQERMLLVADKERAVEVLDVFSKWGLDASIVGEVTEKPNMVITQHGALVADIPNKSLTDDAPLYHRPVGVWKAPVPLDPPAWVLEELQKPRDYTADLKKLLASANICDKRWVFEQYDSMVQTNTVQGPGGEAGVMRIKGTGTPGHERGLAMALAGNGRWTYLDPKLGAMHAVAEAARKVACTGATPVSATNCLNFGNPEKPEIMAQLSQAIDGIAEACIALGTPVTGGNVSLYNETKGEGIYPTPVLGIVGIIDDVTKAVGSSFKNVGEVIALLVPPSNPGTYQKVENDEDAQAVVDNWVDRTNRRLGSSEFAKTILNVMWGTPPPLHLDGEAELHRFLSLLAEKDLLTTAKDVSDGGVAVALAQMTFARNIGATVNKGGLNPVTGLFEEDASTVIVTFPSHQLEQIKLMAQPFGIWVNEIGKTEGDRLRIEISSQLVIDETISSLKTVWAEALEEQLAGEVVTA